MIIKYDKYLDILTIRKERESIKSSLRSGPIIYDFSFDGKIVGVEILNVFETFGKVLNLNQNDFENIKRAKIRSIIRPDMIAVYLMLIIREKEYNPVLTIPLKSAKIRF